MVALLIHLLVICLVLGLIWYVLTLIPIPAPFALIVRIVFVLIAVLILLNFLSGVGGLSLNTGGRYW